jgi:hypothetical protein
MNWKQVKTIESFYNFSNESWMDALELGYIVYFPKELGIIIRDINSYNILFNSKEYLDSDVYYYVFNNKLFFRINNSLFELKTRNFDFHLICKTNEAYIEMLNDSYLLGRTSSRKPRINRNEIIRKSDGSILYKWEDKSFVIHSNENGLFLFEDYDFAVLKRIDVELKKEVWRYHFNKIFPGRRYYKQVSKDIILAIEEYESSPSENSKYVLIGLNLESGEVIFRSEKNHFSTYVYSKELKKLFGIEGQIFRSVDPYSGEIISEREIKELKSHYVNGRQSINKDKLYFSTYGSEIGCFDIKNETFEYFLNVDIDISKVDIQRPLDTPIVSNNKLYIRDNSSVLHIYQEM